MTVASEACGPTSLAWTGVETAFAAGFIALSATHLEAYYQPAAGAQVTLTRGVHFTSALDGGGNVTVTPLALPPAPGTLILQRRTPAVQATDFSNLASFAPAIHTALHDASALRDAELKRDIASIRDHQWVPVFAVIPNGARRVQQVVDWSGGIGVKPPAGFYLGPAGYTLDIAVATDVRGLQGQDGRPGSPGASFGTILLTDIGAPATVLGRLNAYFNGYRPDLAVSPDGTVTPSARAAAHDNYVALQAFYDELAARGGDGVIEPGFGYTSQTPEFAWAYGTTSTRISAWGAMIANDPAQAHSALKLLYIPGAYVVDAAKKLWIEGLGVLAVGNPLAHSGILNLGYPNVTYQGITVMAGNAGAQAPNQADYSGIYLKQLLPDDPDTGGFYQRVEDGILSGLDPTTGPIPFGVTVDGSSGNAVVIERNRFERGGAAVRLICSNAVFAEGGYVSNGVTVERNSIQSFQDGVRVNGISGVSTLDNFHMKSNRLEGILQSCFSYQLDRNGLSPPVIGPNEVDSAIWAGGRYIYNPNNLLIDCRDEFPAVVDIAIPDVGAGLIATLGATIPVNFANGTDSVVVECPALAGSPLRFFGQVTTNALTNGGVGLVTVKVHNFSAGAITGVGTKRVRLRVLHRA